MIPVELSPEPETFDEQVRQPGLAWLRENGVAFDQPPPDPAQLPPHWRKTSKELWDAYDGICAYLSIFFEFVLGAHSTEHFVAKSRDAGLAYEWSNYRLTCLGANRRKNRFDDVLDPFEIESDTFVLNFASGGIAPNSEKPCQTQERAWATIRRLGLGTPEMNKMRACHFSDYCNGDVSESYLRCRSPFVWHEANRQGLL